MLSLIKRLFEQLIRKSTYISHEPINKVSIVIIIIIDIFVLINVFSGLDSIAQWPLNPTEEFPCFLAYENYQKASNKGTFELNAATIENLIQEHQDYADRVENNSNRLGQVSHLCDNITRLEKQINNRENLKLKANIQGNRVAITNLKQDIQTLEDQYNSTLLEKIAGQAPQKSINKATADKIKSEIERNKNEIAQKNQQILEKQQQLIQSSDAAEYLKLLNNISDYKQLKQAFQSAEFWYPNKQLFLQTLFLLPLILIGYFWHKYATKNQQGLQALISWHLLLIFCIPLLIKLFEFIQFGNIIRIILEAITTLLGGLLFIASYGLIIIIPLVGYGLIKLLQIFIFNPRLQAKKRLQKIRCIHCNSKLRLDDEYCPYCGFHQYIECSNCHHKTYKSTNFCHVCGHQSEQEEI